MSLSSISSSITTPLRPVADDLLYDAIMDVINQTPVEDKNVYGRRGMLLVAAGISATTKYFFIPVAMKLPAGPLWASFNCIGWFFLESGFSYQFIQNVMSPTLPSEERLLAHCTLSRSTKVAIAIPSFAIGAVSQLTAALQALKYNPASSKFLVTTITATSTGFYPAVSTQESIVAIMEKVQQYKSPPDNFEMKLIKLRSALVGMVKANHRSFLEMNAGDKILKVSEFVTLQSLDGQAKYTQYMMLMLKCLKQPAADRGPTTWERVGWFARKTGAVFFTGCGEYCGALYTVKYAKESFDYDSDPFARGMASLYALTGAYITWKLNDWMMYYMGGALTGTREKNMAEQLYPWTTVTLASLAFIADFFSQGSVWEIWGDFAKEKGYEDDSLFYQLTQCAGTFLILFASTLGTIKVGLEYYNQTRGGMTEKSLMQLDEQFTRITTLLDKTSFLDLCVHLSRFPSDLKREILSDLLSAHKLTQQQLRTYITNKTGRDGLDLELGEKHDE